MADGRENLRYIYKERDSIQQEINSIWYIGI